MNPFTRLYRYQYFVMHNVVKGRAVILIRIFVINVIIDLYLFGRY